VAFIYTMEYYSAIKKKEIMSFAEKWIELEMILWSEISQVQKDKYHMFSLIYGIQT
jgi:RNase P/RNase MRP subunit p30